MQVLPCFFDIFFISFNELNHQYNLQRIKDRFPTVRHVSNIKGIANAHRECARRANTNMFYTIDADTIVDDDWNFLVGVPDYDQKYLHIWNSRNPINDLEYGYGAVKLWPTELVLNHNESYLDYSTSIGDIKIIEQTISTTHFNTSPYDTWRSAFRESVKLTLNCTKNKDDIYSLNRLTVWMTYANDTADYSDWCIKGSNDGVKWYHENQSNLSKINDFNWLYQEFSARYC